MQHSVLVSGSCNLSSSYQWFKKSVIFSENLVNGATSQELINVKKDFVPSKIYYL